LKNLGENFDNKVLQWTSSLCEKLNEKQLDESCMCLQETPLQSISVEEDDTLTDDENNSFDSDVSEDPEEYLLDGGIEVDRDLDDQVESINQ
jgi:hypothetical protein